MVQMECGKTVKTPHRKGSPAHAGARARTGKRKLFPWGGMEAPPPLHFRPSDPCTGIQRAAKGILEAEVQTEEPDELAALRLLGEGHQKSTDC